MNDKRIGKIKSVRIGDGGYQDAMFGISFDLGSDKESWGVGDFWGGRGMSIKPDGPSYKWTEKDRLKQYADTFVRLAHLMADANVTEVGKLVGRPIEVEFEANTLKSWRILTEAI